MVIAAVGLLTLTTAAGFRSTTGILIVPLQNEFGWSRATIGFAIAINLVIYGLGGPFAAAVVDKYGMRRVITFAVLAVALGAGLSTRMNALCQLDILWGVVNAAATGAISVPLAAMIANRWFAWRRGLVTGRRYGGWRGAGARSAARAHLHARPALGHRPRSLR